jgi:hypothetical protein
MEYRQSNPCFIRGKIFFEPYIYWGVMRIYFFISSIFLLLLSQTVQSLVLPDSTRAIMCIRTAHDSLQVLLDGTAVGRTPLPSLPIPAGHHELRVQSPQWPSLQVDDFVTIFSAAAGDTFTADVEFPVFFRINSIPYQARVLVDGQQMGETPLVLAGPPAGVRLRLEKNGYEPWEVTFASWQDSAHVIRLKPEAVWLAQQERDAGRAKRNTEWHRRGLYGSLLLGLVSGAATIYYRDQGNEAYSCYLGTADPVKMEHYYSRARRHDRIAGASYAVFEVSFILSGYFFLKSRH